MCISLSLFLSYTFQVPGSLLTDMRSLPHYTALLPESGDLKSCFYTSDILEVGDVQPAVKKKTGKTGALLFSSTYERRLQQQQTEFVVTILGER